MNARDFRRAGHTPSLVAALLHFDVSFMAWVLLGALGAYVAEDLDLGPAAKGLLVAVPLLSAAGFRVALGVLGDRLGPRRIGIASLLVVLVPLAWGWLGARSYGALLGVGVLLGVAGASFAIALPLASRWYPPRHQGLAMGIAGAGNSGTVLTTLVAPRLAESWGWHAVFGAAMAPVALVALAFALLAKEPPAPPGQLNVRELGRLARERDAWWLCALYAMTFGGFVGLASFAPIYLHDAFALTKVEAATVTALGGALGSLLRPVGGVLADRHGGTAVLAVVYALAAVLLLVAAEAPATPAVMAVPAVMGTLGAGNGAVFQLVGLRFSERIGVITGLVGACGGIGGFALPTLLGTTRELAGSYGAGLVLVAAAATAALVATLALRGAWRAAGAVPAEARA